ncbi:protein quaking [Mastomys coucha]|uniref:protein quaking n=1 Tax=Mastomys coucha TaxID=35658 RepID=UPI00126260EB|nr:protein quaking [Mastomys coucha]
MFGVSLSCFLHLYHTWRVGASGQCKDNLDVTEDRRLSAIFHQFSPLCALGDSTALYASNGSYSLHVYSAFTLHCCRSGEISRVRKDMYNDTLNGSTEKRSAELPDAVGPIVQLQEKLYVPVKEYPDFNFVGRILGPRGLTAKQLEAETGCKIMVRGKGSMRDKKKEEQNRGKPNWEHLNEDLHVLITVEDAQNRAEIKLKRAVEEVKKLLVPAAEGEDSLKKMQLMELAILNGTYYTLAPATSILEYPIEPSGVLGAVATKVRRHDMRVHPYQRIVTADRAATGN